MIGPQAHTFQWGVAWDVINERKKDVRAFYTTADAAQAEEILKKYNVSFVVCGEMERREYGVEAVGRVEQRMRVVFQDGEGDERNNNSRRAVVAVARLKSSKVKVMSKKFKDKNDDSSGRKGSATSATLDPAENLGRDSREADRKRASGFDRDARDGGVGRERREQGSHPAAAATKLEAWTALDSRYIYAAGALLIIGALLRLVMLHAPPFMHDEAIHAMFAYNFETYKYDPIYHGPLLYYLVAAVFAVVGDYDFTARLVPALMGIALMAIVIGPTRRWLGDRAALWSLALS
ncbi:MAG: hypothetical protein WKF84_20130 [Pyrinomonadaceae bacterium]